MRASPKGAWRVVVVRALYIGAFGRSSDHIPPTTDIERTQENARNILVGDIRKGRRRLSEDPMRFIYVRPYRPWESLQFGR